MYCILQEHCCFIMFYIKGGMQERDQLDSYLIIVL